MFANVLSSLDPPSPIFVPPLFAERIQRWPVRLMLILKFELAAKVYQQLLCRDVVRQSIVEDHLGLGDGIDEWRYEREEGFDVPRHCWALLAAPHSPTYILGERMDSRSLIRALPSLSG